MKSQIKQIGAVVLENPLWIEEYGTPNTMMGEVEMSLDGTHIAYSAEIKTPYRTASSQSDSGWIGETEMLALQALWEAGTTFDITYVDDATETVRMAHEKQISFDEISLGACIYNGIIPMAKV